MGDRSIYYGALLYIGELSGHFWLSIFIQGAIFLFLLYTLAVTCLGLSFSTFAVVSFGVLLLTPASFFISLLMPDIFAAFLILATIILMVFWERLTQRDRFIVGAIILFCVLAHGTHLLLLVCLVLVFGAISLFQGRKAAASGRIRRQAVVLIALIFLGFLGDAAFSFAVKLALGTKPLRPSFIMARLIADGAGYRFLKVKCDTKPYVICNYINRLPADADLFLWSKDPEHGVFSVVDLDTRNALASEELSFAVDVLRFDPIEVLKSATKNSLNELRDVGLFEFLFMPYDVAYLKDSLPHTYFDDMLRGRLIFQTRLKTLGDVYAALYFVSGAGLIFCLAFWPRIQAIGNFDRRWPRVLVLALAGIASNAAICGALSGTHPRYQTRIAWIPLFMLFLLVAGYWRTRALKNSE